MNHGKNESLSKERSIRISLDGWMNDAWMKGWDGWMDGNGQPDLPNRSPHDLFPSEPQLPLHAWNPRMQTRGGGGKKKKEERDEWMTEILRNQKEFGFSPEIGTINHDQAKPFVLPHPSPGISELTGL